MLKDNDASEHMVPTPPKRGVTRIGNEAAGKSVPATNQDLPQDSMTDKSMEVLRQLRVDCPTSGERDRSHCDVEEDNVDDFMIDFTEDEITYLQASLFESKETARYVLTPCNQKLRLNNISFYRGSPPLKCPQLGDPPDPKDIIDVYLPVLGDPFHAMDRPKVSIKQDLKKSYYVAFMNAWLIWDDTLMDELRTRMAATGLSEEDIDAELFYKPSLFKGCVDRHVPRVNWSSAV